MVLALLLSCSLQPALPAAHAASGCTLDITIGNRTGERVHVWTEGAAGNDVGSAVKVRGGTWRSFREGGWKRRKQLSVAPDRTKRGRYKADQSCEARRRYRVAYTCGERANVEYFPDAKGFYEKGEQVLTLDLTRC